MNLAEISLFFLTLVKYLFVMRPRLLGPVIAIFQAIAGTLLGYSEGLYWLMGTFVILGVLDIIWFYKWHKEQRKWY